MASLINQIPDAAKNAEAKSAALVTALDPLNSVEATKGTIPFYSTGARALVKVGGKPLAVVQDFKWSVQYNATPIQTIDTIFPFDIDVGACVVSAAITMYLSPTQGPEAQGLLAPMSAGPHQPLVEIQVLDAVGTSLFFSRGMFTSVNGSVSLGNMSTISASYTGIAFQHWVSQSFTPYNSVSAGLSAFVGGLGSLLSTGSGGFL